MRRVFGDGIVAGGAVVEVPDFWLMKHDIFQA